MRDPIATIGLFRTMIDTRKRSIGCRDANGTARHAAVGPLGPATGRLACALHPRKSFASNRRAGSAEQLESVQEPQVRYWRELPVCKAPSMWTISAAAPRPESGRLPALADHARGNRCSLISASARLHEDHLWCRPCRHPPPQLSLATGVGRWRAVI